MLNPPECVIIPLEGGLQNVSDNEESPGGFAEKPAAEKASG